MGKLVKYTLGLYLVNRNGSMSVLITRLYLCEVFLFMEDGGKSVQKFILY